MGILNVTPNSFFDGGEYLDIDRAIQRAHQMVSEGADIIDIGGESTKPGSESVSIDVEIQRTIPIIKILSQELSVPISIDTSNPEVMEAAVTSGASFINDINALQTKDALKVASSLKVPICLMHMQGTPKTMQMNPYYHNVVEEIKSFFLERINTCTQYGISHEYLILDPGFGFGKNVTHNLLLLKYLNSICSIGFPVLVGISRKSFIGALLDDPLENRLYGGVSLAALAIWEGAKIIRTHDVRATKQILTLYDKVMKVNNERE
ncbi:dihydropteroate synthase [Candidatus Nitrosacidococcus sp. I8]|uniref:dihydropteroate synthase n=1 Tax=Candidatus Nitrosacidococcus sp. I8 TaxID=2942908 RepID=UPI0022270428|nr:dihydropteroate synthase [Candidatus Nitrosacidococcus sp. I8]CAH9016384.1 Dihydropteroate synthase [Candidatus Nitrosacidococcus sp. I8]